MWKSSRSLGEFEGSGMYGCSTIGAFRFCLRGSPFGLLRLLSARLRLVCVFSLLSISTSFKWQSRLLLPSPVVSGESDSMVFLYFSRDLDNTNGCKPPLERWLKMSWLPIVQFSGSFFSTVTSLFVVSAGYLSIELPLVEYKFLALSGKEFLTF